MEDVANNTPINGYERKLLSGMLFVMMAFLPTVGFAMYCLSDVGKTENQLDSVYTKTLLLAEDLRTAKVRQDAVIPAFVLSGDQTLLDELKKSDADFSATLSELETMPLQPASKATLADISFLQDRLLAVERAGIDMKKGGGTTAEVERYFRREALPFIRPILNDLDQFVKVTSETRAREKARANRNIRIVFRILAVAGSVTALLSAAVTGLLVCLAGRKKTYDLLNVRLAQREKEVSTARKETLETVAHDLKNPLSAIMMAAELLHRQSDMPTSAKQRIGMISSSVESMNRLIANLLDHTKIESGSLALMKETCDLGTILTLLISRFELLAEVKGLKIVDETSAERPALFIDPARIEQVFSNLLGNAVKFTPPGGTIRISDAVEKDMLVIAISDNGPGMTPEQTAHVFERYWQAGETASRGTGLGLAISKAIVNAHDGSISVRSEPGVGSAFSVALPIASKAATHAA